AWRSGSACWELIVSVQTGQRVSLEQIRAFLEASDEVHFEAQDKEQVYVWIERTLREQGWNGLSRASRGLVRRYLAKMTGLSRAQITRLIKLYSKGEAVQPKSYRRHRFASRYNRADIELLASVDEAHETLSGPATQKILQREFHDFGDPQYERLGQISVAHLYRLGRGRGSLWLLGVGCGGAGPTVSGELCISRRMRQRWRLASGEPRNRRGGPGSCAWIPFIKAIWTESKGCTTSAPWMK